MKTATGVDVELIASGGGVFEIMVDGTKVFSKKALGRFPRDGEVVELIGGRRQA